MRPFVFASLFDHSPAGEYLLSPSDDPVILAVNDTFLRAAGRTRESLVGKRLFAVFPGNPEDTGDTGVAALRASLARVIDTGRADPLPLQRYPIRVLGPDGSETYEERYWRAVSTPIFAPDGALFCIAHRTEDVTEQTGVAEALRRSNERQAFQLALADRLRSLTSPDQIASAALDILGEKLRIARVTYVEVDDPSGTFVQRHWVRAGRLDVSPERRRLEAFGPAIIGTLRRGEALVIRDVLADPRTRDHAAAYASIGVRANLAIPLVKSGQLTLVLSLQHDQPRDWTPFEIELATDVAERTWSAAENARAQEELRQANRRKDDFLAMLAHELRNPLAPISAAAELLASHHLDDARLRMTGAVIARQARHMTALVEDLLDVSRVTRGLVSLAQQPQDLNAIVADAVEQVRPLIDANRHQLDLQRPREPALVLGDGKRLVQVIGNLLNNAAKYTPAGGHITVEVTAGEAAVRVDVRDNGIGVTRDLQPRIFELFEQAERTPERAQGGLGLGLALVKSLVELHGGSVAVASEGTGAGSCFTVTLPRLPATAQPVTDARNAAADDAVNAAAAQATAEAAAEPPSASTSISAAVASAASAAATGLDILVVDDNADAAEMLKLLLEDAGHRVRVANEPARALELAAARAPQAGFIDIGLPGMDGYELVRRLRALPSGAGALYVALTGYGQAADRSKAMEAGFDAHLVKPADPVRLLSLLEHLRAG